MELEGATVWRARSEGGRAVLLAPVDWRVLPGERWAVVGANGAGKATLLSLAAAWSHPSEGRVRILGRRLGAGDARGIRAVVGHVDATLAESFGPRMTALGVALTGATGAIALRRERAARHERRRAEGLMAEMGCLALAHRPFAQLSRGERQRVLLARSLMPDPRLLLLDEPTAGLDLPGREEFLARLDALACERPELAVVQVSHHLEELAGSVSHALLLAGGRAVAMGRAAEVLREEPLSRCFGAPVRLAHAGGRLLATIDRDGRS